MISIYLCDDNPVILEKYKALLLEISGKENIQTQISTFQSGEQLLFCMEDASPAPDIIYLDIMMGGANGMEVAGKLRASGCTSELIFLTSNPEFVFDSFDVSPAYYIVKDTITKERFSDIFLKTASLALTKADSFFTCSNSTVQKQIPIRDISYFEIRNRIITVHYGHETFDFYSRLEDIEHELSNQMFIRIHRSYLVQTRYIQQIARRFVLLATGEELPLGITYAKQVKLAVAQNL